VTTTPPVKRRLSLVVPVYCNEGSLRELAAELRRVEEELAARGLELEVVFVDDGSTDGSLPVLLDVKRQWPAIKVVKLTRNFGAVQAGKVGLRHVTGECFQFLSADLQEPPEVVVQMADRWLAGSKFVVALREQRHDPLPTRILARFYYWMVRRLAVPSYPAGGYGMALMTSAMLPYLLESPKNINTPMYAYWLGLQPDTLSYVRRKRRHGRSRWTVRKRVGLFVDSLVGFSILPIRLVSLLGMLVAGASFLYGGFIVVQALRGASGAPGFATIVVLLAFLLGVVMITLGAMGEYLARIYDEVSGKPAAVVEEVW
jgi:dolichol-phosphate mannosyltransferase